jgi:hypothetical protein
MTTSLLHRRDHVVAAARHEDVLVVEARGSRRSRWMPVAVTGAVVAAVVTSGAVTWDGSRPGGAGAGVVEPGTGPSGPVPHPQPGPVARPDR